MRPAKLPLLFGRLNPRFTHRSIDELLDLYVHIKKNSWPKLVVKVLADEVGNPRQRARRLRQTQDGYLARVVRANAVEKAVACFQETTAQGQTVRFHA
jgi:hypothetical protein